MTIPDATAPGPSAPALGAGGAVAPIGLGRRLLRGAVHVLAMTPFSLYMALGLAAPIVAVVILAFHDHAGNWTLANIKLLFHAPYSKAFGDSLQLAAVTSIIPGILGVVLAYAIATSKSEVFRRIVAAASGVLANFGGVNLAFIFITAYGATGLATVWLANRSFSIFGWHVDLNPWNHGFDLYNFSGVALIYMYFQIPLMVLLVTPALGGLRESWREATSNLGGGMFRYWYHVGIPVLLPSIAGGMLLLFGSGFSAYATADALTTGSIPLAPILIGDFLNGNVVAGQENVGYAIGFGMVVVLVVTMGGYLLLQRWATRWLR